jgi:HEAT repeat protein/GT2 family glycosyltransferase
MEVSIIVRFYNEAIYLPTVMEALIQQDFPSGQYEIITIDNCSTDNSRDIVSRYTKNLLKIDDYQPGKALNRAISESKGKNIAVLSAHAIPSNRTWLQTLHAHMKDAEVAGVYGAQLYPANSKFLDKRDLDIFSTLTPRVEKENSDFWNANSMFPRSVWERQPFDETTLELEDHYWTKQVLPRGYEIHFEPAALIYHYGHINRIDREHLPVSSLSDRELIESAIDDLERETDWPTLMRAGLILSSLSRSPFIKQAIHPLGKRLLTHEDFDVRWRMAQALGKIRDEASVNYLVRALFDSSFYPRDEAAWSLARLGDLSVKNLLAHLNEFTSEMIPFAALALGRSGVESAEEQAVNLLLAEIRSGDTTRQRDAIYFAGEIVEAATSERLIPSINHLLDSADTRLQAVCCWALGCFARRFPEAIAWEKIEATAKFHADALSRFEAVIALGKLALVKPTHRHLELLISRLADKESRVRYGAMQSIRLLVEEHGAIPQASRLQSWQDEDFGVRYEAALIKQRCHASAG